MGYRISGVIDVRAQEVWAVLSDVERWPDWSPTMTWVRPIDDATGLRAGTRVRIKQPGLPVNRWTVRVTDPGRAFTWTTGNPLVTVHGHHVVEPLGHGRCQVTLEIDETGPLAFLARRLLHARNEHNLETELSHLRQTCERRFRSTEST